MTRIEFHSDVADKITFCCRLARKAHKMHAQLVVLTADRDELNTLDQALWTFSDLDFLPHVIVDDPLAVTTPIVLSDRDDIEFPHHQVLVNLSRTPPANFARFERLIELVAHDEADRTAGRERFRFYKQRGYAIKHHSAEQA